MKTNKVVAALAVVSIVLPLSLMHSVVQAQDIKNSVVTLEEMLKIDNAQALEKARSDAVKFGLAQPTKALGQQVEVPLPQWTVKSVFGFSNHLSADILMDGSPFYSISKGSTVAMCKVQSIEDSCVKLAPSSKKTRKGACPAKVCWTGNEMTADLQPAQTVVGGVATGSNYKLAPAPLPMAPIPIPTGSEKIQPVTR